MAINTINKRTSMALFSDPKDHYCHRVRIVLDEKGILSEIIDSDHDKLSEDVLEVSPYGTLPVLVDRDVSLYDSVTLMEYLDERFPHPPLLPVYPGTRANMRLYIKRIEKEFNDYVLNKESKVNANFVIGETNMNILFEAKNFNHFIKFYNK